MRRSFRIRVACERLRARRNPGTAIAASNAIIATTIMISTRVKPPRRLLMAFNMLLLSLSFVCLTALRDTIVEVLLWSSVDANLSAFSPFSREYALHRKPVTPGARIVLEWRREILEIGLPPLYRCQPLHFRGCLSPAHRCPDKADRVSVPAPHAWGHALL